MYLTRSLKNRLNRRQRSRQAYAIQERHSLIVSNTYDIVSEFMSSLDVHELNHMCRQMLSFITGKLKAQKSVMLIDVGSDSFKLYASHGFSQAELRGVGYVATYTPFCRKLLRKLPFEHSNCSELLDELNRSSRLFFLNIRYWIPIVISEEDRLIGIIGVDTPAKSLCQHTYAKAFAQIAPRLLQSSILSYRLHEKQQASDYDVSTQEKLRSCLHTTRRLASMSCNCQKEIVSSAAELLEENLYAKRMVIFTTDNLSEYRPIKTVGIDDFIYSDMVFMPNRDIFSRMLKAGKLFELRLSSLKRDSIPYLLVEHGLNFFIPFANNDQNRTLMGFAAVKLPAAPNGYQMLIARFISVMAAMAMRNIMLEAELSETRERHEYQIHKLQMLYDVGRALSVIDNRTELLKQILGHASDIVQAEKGSVMLLNANQRLEVNVVKGIDEEIADQILHGKIRTTTLALGEGIAGTVAKTGRPILINDVSSIKSNRDSDNNSENSVTFVTSKTSHVSSILCVPLRAHNEVIGVINITNKKQGKEFTTDDQRIVEQVADQAAIAIHNARLYELATTDSLTKVLVRHQLFMRLEDELKRLSRSHERKSVTIVMVDIDFFKSINDRFGHPFGDKVLVEVANTLRSSVRSVDSICRYGGEEFCIILPETDLIGGKLVGRRISRLLEKLDLQSDDGTQVRVSISGGIATCSNYRNVDAAQNEGKSYKIVGNAITLSELIKRADVALYYSKQHGRNQFTAFEDIYCHTNPEAICTCEKHDISTCRVAKQAKMKRHIDSEGIQSPDESTSNEAESAHNVAYESDMRL
ncbi:diguanylate cyclase [bacterium]|nr:diguanylate cyclase [bacterium]